MANGWSTCGGGGLRGCVGLLAVRRFWHKKTSNHFAAVRRFVTGTVLLTRESLVVGVDRTIPLTVTPYKI